MRPVGVIVGHAVILFCCYTVLWNVSTVADVQLLPCPYYSTVRLSNYLHRVLSAEDRLPEP
jgi:hypothetical protein